MRPTTYQVPQIRDENNRIIQDGAWGKDTDFSNVQNTGILDYIINNLEYLRNEARMISTPADLGLELPCTTVDIIKAMANNSMAVINVETKTGNITDVPASYGILTIKRGNSVQRSDIEYKQSSSTGGTNRYYASFNSSNDTITWYKYTSTVV